MKTAISVISLALLLSLYSCSGSGGGLDPKAFYSVCEMIETAQDHRVDYYNSFPDATEEEACLEPYTKGIIESMGWTESGSDFVIILKDDTGGDCTVNCYFDAFAAKYAKETAKVGEMFYLEGLATQTSGPMILDDCTALKVKK